MAKLDFVEKKKLEQFLLMEGGYVLDFTDRTFSEFFESVLGIDVYDKRYAYRTGSKANRMRGFWKADSNHSVGIVLDKMIDYAEGRGLTPEQRIVRDGCRQIASRLLDGAPVALHEVIDSAAAVLKVEQIANEVKEAIDSNRLQEGIDRLHTMTTAYVAHLASDRGIEAEGKSLDAVFGEYRKAIIAEGLTGEEFDEVEETVERRRYSLLMPQRHLTPTTPVSYTPYSS